MKVALIAHYLDESVGHGMDRYSFKLREGLQARKISVSSVSCPAAFLGPVKSLLDFFLLIPLKMLFASGDVFHLLAPQAGLVLPLFKALRRKKVVVTIYDLNPLLHKGRNPVAFALIIPALKSAIKNSDLILAISSQTKADILEHIKVDEKKIWVTPLAADQKFRPMKRPKNDLFTVGYIGGFAANKNVPFLIRAYSLFEKKGIPSRLVLYGKGAQYEECRKLASGLKVKNVEFRGFAPEERIVEIYNSFDVFVFPSEIEGFGLPIIEARMCRVPTVVKEGSHVPEEVTRHCLKAKDGKDLAGILERLSREGYEFTPEHVKYLENFSWDGCIGRTVDAYKEVLG